MRVTVYGTEADRRELADLLACLYFLCATASSEQWQENLP